MADVLDHRQVVRDEQVGQAELVLQVHQQVDDLRLHRHVERRHRLVADDQARAAARARARCRGAGAGRRRTRTGYFTIWSARRPTLSNSAATRSRDLARRWRIRNCGAARRRCPPARMRGLSEEYGSWNTTCSSRRCGRICARRQRVDALAAPADFAAGRARSAAGSPWPVVDLPQPRFADQAQRLARARSLKLTPSTACTWPLTRAKSALAHREVDLCRSCTSQQRVAHARRLHAIRADSQQATDVAAAVRVERRRLRRGSASTACGQRGANAQPAIGSRSDGTMPGISARRLRTRFARRPGAASSPAGRACRDGSGRVEQRADRRLLDLAPGVHHHHALRHLGDDAQVVRDQQDRRAGLRASARASGRGSAPGW